MENFQLAQINVARMKGVSIDDPVMKEFVDNLDKINSLAENSKGFVWRLKDESNNATHLNPYSDEQVIINISVWETIEDLERFVYRSFHTDFLSSRFFYIVFLFYFANSFSTSAGVPSSSEANLSTRESRGLVS